MRIVIFILMLLTLAVVIAGVIKMASNKSPAKQNKLMMLRVMLQAAVIAILALLYFSR